MSELLWALVDGFICYTLGYLAGSMQARAFAQQLHADVCRFVADAVASVGGIPAQVELMQKLNARLDIERPSEK